MLKNHLYYIKKNKKNFIFMYLEIILFMYNYININYFINFFKFKRKNIKLSFQ